MGRRRKTKQLTPAQIRTAQAHRLVRERAAMARTVHLEPTPDTARLFHGESQKLEPAGPVDTLPADIPFGIIVNKWPIQSWADITHHVPLSQAAFDWVTTEIERNHPENYAPGNTESPVLTKAEVESKWLKDTQDGTTQLPLIAAYRKAGYIAAPPEQVAAELPELTEEEQKIRRRRLIGLGVIQGFKYERSIKPIKPTPQFGQVTVAYDGIKDLVLLIAACQNCNRGHRALGNVPPQMRDNWTMAGTQDELENMAQALLNFALKIAGFDDIKLVADYFGLAINYYGWDNQELMNAKRKALVAHGELIAATKPD